MLQETYTEPSQVGQIRGYLSGMQHVRSRRYPLPYTGPNFPARSIAIEVLEQGTPLLR